jgi:hypothetical protein
MDFSQAVQAENYEGQEGADLQPIFCSWSQSKYLLKKT